MKGHTLRAREASRDMKASIDELAEKLLRQVREGSDKKTTKRRAVEKHANGDASAADDAD
jgi:ribosome-associated translation inhibitor RaiA